MWEAIKLGLAGLMLILDLLGVSGANQLVVGMIQNAGVTNLNTVKKTEAVKPKETVLPQLILSGSTPKINDSLNYPIIDATSAIIIDAETGMVLYEKNSFARLPMASLTKLMTAVVAIDNLRLDDIATIDVEDTYIEPLVMNLQPGEQITIGNILSGLLIGSNNDAALALARVGGNGSMEDFYQKMNEKAQTLGMKDSHFSNSHGLDDPELYSSAHDLAMLAKYAMNNSIIADLVSTKEMVVTDINGTIEHNLKTTNKLLDSYLPIEGVKTGFTDNAGQTLITQASYKGHKIISVVLGSNDRFQDSKQLIDWVMKNYYWE